VRIEAAAASISHTVNPQKSTIGSMAVAEPRSGGTEMTAGRPARNIYAANWFTLGAIQALSASEAPTAAFPDA